MVSSFAGPNANCQPESEFAQKLFENTQIYSPYETSDPSFDKSNLNQFAGHLRCPEINKEMIFKFLDFGKRENWGKRRQPQAQVGRWIESHLTDIAVAAQRTMAALHIRRNHGPFPIGLDIHGPGGGQWQLAAGRRSFPHYARPARSILPGNQTERSADQ